MLVQMHFREKKSYTEVELSRLRWALPKALPPALGVLCLSIVCKNQVTSSVFLDFCSGSFCAVLSLFLSDAQQNTIPF